MSKGVGTSVVCSVAPMLSVRNGARAVEFYKSAFGAIEVFRIEAPSGAVVSRLSVDGAEFWVSDESPEHANFMAAGLNDSHPLVFEIGDRADVHPQPLSGLIWPFRRPHGAVRCPLPSSRRDGKRCRRRRRGASRPGGGS